MQFEHDASALQPQKDVSMRISDNIADENTLNNQTNCSNLPVDYATSAVSADNTPARATEISTQDERNVNKLQISVPPGLACQPQQRDHLASEALQTEQQGAQVPGAHPVALNSQMHGVGGSRYNGSRSMPNSKPKNSRRAWEPNQSNGIPRNLAHNPSHPGIRNANSNLENIPPVPVNQGNNSLQFFNSPARDGANFSVPNPNSQNILQKPLYSRRNLSQIAVNAEFPMPGSNFQSIPPNIPQMPVYQSNDSLNSGLTMANFVDLQNLSQAFNLQNFTFELGDEVSSVGHSTSQNVSQASDVAQVGWIDRNLQNFANPNKQQFVPSNAPVQSKREEPDTTHYYADKYDSNILNDDDHDPFDSCSELHEDELDDFPDSPSAPEYDPSQQYDGGYSQTQSQSTFQMSQARFGFDSYNTQMPTMYSGNQAQMHGMGIPFVASQMFRNPQCSQQEPWRPEAAKYIERVYGVRIRPEDYRVLNIEYIPVSQDERNINTNGYSQILNFSQVPFVQENSKNEMTNQNLNPLKRKCEADDSDGVGSASTPTRYRKRTRSSGKSKYDTSFYDAGPPEKVFFIHDDKGSTCRYLRPKNGKPCGKFLRGDVKRKRYRHLATHAYREENLIVKGIMKSDDAVMLKRLPKVVVKCKVEGCNWRREVWRTDHVRENHELDSHPDLYAERLARRKEKKTKEGSKSPEPSHEQPKEEVQ